MDFVFLTVKKCIIFIDILFEFLVLYSHKFGMRTKLDVAKFWDVLIFINGSVQKSISVHHRERTMKHRKQKAGKNPPNN